MTKGSCACGKTQYEYSGEPAAKVNGPYRFVLIRTITNNLVSQAACHCIPCRKTSGTTNSYNLMVPSDKFKITAGSLNKFTRKGDSGKNVTYYYCQDCPTVMYVDVEAMAGLYIVKMGTVDDDDVFNNLGLPGLEIYTKNRPEWCPQIPGAEQKTTA